MSKENTIKKIKFIKECFGTYTYISECVKCKFKNECKKVFFDDLDDFDIDGLTYKFDMAMWDLRNNEKNKNN